MTALELINDLAIKAGIDSNNPEFKALLSSPALMQVPIPDVVTEAINTGLYTRDAALNSKEIYDQHEKQARGRFYGIMDNKVGQFLTAFDEYLTDEQKGEIKKQDNTPSKLDLINKYLPTALAEKFKQDNNSKKPNEGEIRRLEEEYNTKIKTEKEAVQSEWEQKVTQLQTEFEHERINSYLAQKIFSHNLIDNIPGGKDFLANAIFNDLTREYHLKHEKGVGVLLLRKDDPEKEVFINNTKQTIDTVLSEKLKDFVKKSDVKTSTTDGGNRSPFTVPEKPNNRMSLAEQNRLKAQEEAKKLAAQYQN